MKQIDTLFHSTKKLDELISIIENGFYASYSDEIIANRNMKVLMVSFSNIALLESKTQVSYGSFSIGLKRSWAIEKKLHPVSYTYANSIFEKSIDKLLRISVAGHVLPAAYSDKLIMKDEKFSIFNELLTHSNITHDVLQKISTVFLELAESTITMQPYLKNYKVIGKDGRHIEAYNDREWRFLPDLNIQQILIYETDPTGQYINPKFTEITNSQKPHFTDQPLNFDIVDVTNIIVETKNQISIIYKALYKKYGKETIEKLINSGELSINCYENLLNNY